MDKQNFQKQGIFRVNTETDKAVNSAIFKDENYFIYVFKKSERLVSAIYLVTNFFDEREPAKTELRSLALQSLSFAVRLGEYSSYSRPETVKGFGRLLLTIKSLLETLCRVGMISDMNFSILHAEYDNLISIVLSLEKVSQGADDVVLSEQFFSVFGAKVAPQAASAEQRPAGKAERGEGGVRPEVSTEASRQQKDTLPVAQAAPVSKRQMAAPGSMGDKKEIRKNVILSLLRRKESVTIKDVVAVVHDCSEKTIQRELQALVDENVLNKAGERRWTRYFLPK